MSKKLDNLPPSSDKEFWEEAETQVIEKPVRVNICPIHSSKDWKNAIYVENADRTISCKVCPWGTMVPGYIRILDGKIVDLRAL